MIEAVLIASIAAGAIGFVTGYSKASRSAESLLIAERTYIERIGVQSRRIAELESILAQQQAQRVAASQRAAEVNRARAAERRKAATAKTKDAIAHTAFRPRDEVVSGVAAARTARTANA